MFLPFLRVNLFLILCIMVSHMLIFLGFPSIDIPKYVKGIVILVQFKIATK